jgi:FtsH-binding integral membrane protein
MGNWIAARDSGDNQNQMDIYRPQPQVTAAGTRISLQAVMREVYLWMTVGLLISAVVAVTFAATGLTITLAPVLLLSFFVVIGLSWYLGARIFQMSAQRATNVFLLFAALMGASLSGIFYSFDLRDIYLALFSTSAMFAAMSIVGYTTQVDLTRMGGILFMALIGLIVASIVNIFLASTALYWLVSYAGVLIFAGLTAYDTQWIKRTAATLELRAVGGPEVAVRQVAIIGALHLYLDFINLFLFILRIMGGRRR